MTGLDLRVAGDVDSVRGTATGMSALGDSIDDAGAGFGQASAESESMWQGPAADAFRSRIGTAKQATTQVVAATRRMSDALHVFADRMAKVKAEIARAESVAAGAGLDVSGDTITPPTPPPAPAAACYTPAGAAQVMHEQAVAQAKYRRQVRAYQQAERILQQARKDEQTAHQDVGKAADDEKSVLADLNEHKYWLLGGLATGTVATALEQRTTWLHTMNEFGLEYDRLRTAAAAVDDPLLHTVLSAASGQALDDASHAADAAVGNSKLGLGVDPLSDAGKVLDRLPVGLAAVQGVWDVAHASGTKGKVVAGTADAAAFGAGAGVTAVGSGVIEGLAIGGAPETLGLSLLAGGAAYGTGLLVQHYGPGVYDWTTHAAGDVAGSVADTVTHPGRTISNLAGDIGL
ncbi:MAG TPA: hypothetical protein VGL80_09835 [Pseudonocardiaceae bacterium]